MDFCGCWQVDDAWGGKVQLWGLPLGKKGGPNAF